MNESDMDPQRLAALLEDRLDPGERAELMARLAGSEHDFEVFAEAAATLADLREDAAPENDTDDSVTIPADLRVEAEAREPARAEPVERTVIPLRPRPPAWRRPVVGLALAAGLAGAALAPWLFSRGGGVASGPGEVAALLAAPGGIPTGWQPRPWSATRGDAGSRGARASRIGARMVDLELAARSGDSAQVVEITGEVEALLGEVSGGGAAIPPVRRVGERAGAPAGEVLPLLAQAHDAVLVAGEPRVTLGAWAEAARLAAERGDEAFFRARDSRALLDRAAQDESLPPAARAAAERIRGAAGAAAPAWDALQRDATGLLGAIAG